MGKFIIKILLFIAPLIVLVLALGWLLPVNFYYFRCWESLRPKRFFNFFPGPYYPSMRLEMVEKGDLAPHTDLAVDKSVVWQTDQYGYRTTESSDYNDIVIIGSSNIVGTSLTQSDILSEVLARAVQLSVYPYAPRDVRDFLRENRFMNNKPKVVVFSEMERSLSWITPPTELQLAVSGDLSWTDRLRLNPAIASTMVFLDRSLDPVLIKYFKRIITGQFAPPIYKYAYGQMLFNNGEAVNNDVDQTAIDQDVATIIAYQKIFKDLGMQMIFLPIPNKENIYYKMMPNQKKPTFLRKFIDQLVQRGVDVVDTQTLFETAYETNGIQLYQSDDTHWNAAGIQLTADELKRHLEKYGIKK